MSETITISRRFRGPPESANGGFACGLLGSRLPAPARVTLRSPPPLDIPLLLEAGEPGHLVLRRDGTPIADGVDASLSDAVPDPVSLEEAERAAEGFIPISRHPFPTCFVCGPHREEGDGLRIFPGPVAGREIVAAPWTPDPSVCDAAGRVRPEVAWAALDCPSWFGLHAFQPDTGMALLGQMTGRVERLPRSGERCVVTGWPRGREGRKLYGGAAIFSSDGELLGRSETLWIEPRAS